ncbi:hypothetical protein BHE74_00056651 [Ensete ventricosum]|nr:hypothetical protein BHE74_00056651 [Ensete ventricosum]
MAGVVEGYDGMVCHKGSKVTSAYLADTKVGRIHWAGIRFGSNIFVTRRRAHIARTPVWKLGCGAPPETRPPSTNRGGCDSRTDSQPLLEDDDRPGVPFTRIQPRIVRGHDRVFPRPQQPSPSTSGYGAYHGPVPAPARAFDSSPIGSPGDTPANGVTSGPEPGGPARGSAAIASGRRPDASPITKSLLQSNTD